MDVRLVVQSGGRAGREIPITLDDFVIGRDLGCHFRVDHDRVNHHHCRIRRSKNKVLVEDLNSIHGTMVNDHAIRSVEAHDGDRLRVGPATFVLRIGQEAAPKGRDEGLSGELLVPRAPRVVTTNPLDSAFESAAAGSARALLAKLTGGQYEGPDRPRERLRVVDVRGIAVVRLLQPLLIEDDDVREVADALDGLIAAGRVRIAMNFEEVENLAGQAIGVLASAHERCRSAGGLLKLCAIGRQVGHALALMGMDRFFEIARDEPSALDGKWPGPPPAPSSATAPAPPATRVRLVVMAGKARGKAIEVARSKFLIGRDASCHLRPNSPTISRLHTTIEQRGGRVFVRDLGARNSTILNDRVLSGEEAEVADGDRLQVGPLLFTFALGDRDITLDAPASGESAAQWLIPEKDDDEQPTTLMSRTLIQPALSTPAPKPVPKPAVSAPGGTPAPLSALTFEVRDDSLIVTVLSPDLNDEPTVAPIRYELCELFERPLPKRVIIDLGRVRYLSSRGVGVLLAHFQRLGRAGGALRLCQVHPNVVSVLEQMRVPMLIEVFPTREEAIREPWEAAAEPAPSPTS